MATQIKDRLKPTFSLSHRLTSRGFTLLEIMVALTIMVVALLGLLRVMTMGLKGSKRAEEMTIATMLAQRKIEDTRTGYPEIGTTDDTFASPDNNYDWEINVIDGPTDTVREVTVTVSWPHGAVGIKTYIADHS